MHRHVFSRVLAAGLLTLALGVHAQGVTGSAVTGTVTRQGGGPVANAGVQVRNPTTGETFTGVTNASGQYFIDNVQPGPYVLTVTAQGLEPAAQEIELTLGQRLVTDISMRQALVEEISVTGRRPDALADRNRSGASTTVKGASLTEIPLQGRNFTDLTRTDPRVVSIGSGVSIAGQNNRFNNIQIDGGANNDLFGLAANGTPSGQANSKPLSIEAVQEFNIQVAPFDVRQGNFAGGLVNAITKSGTNEFHGSAFAYFQNKQLAGYRDDPTFNDYNSWQFGGSLGGPIIADKAQFFIAGDFQIRSSAFGNQFQIGGVDPVQDKKIAGFDLATSQRFADILATKYGISAGTALAPNLGNPDNNVFAKITSTAIENSHLELSYNFVKANQDTLIRSVSVSAPTLPTSTPTGTSVTSGNLRDGYQMSEGGYGQHNTTNTGRIKLTTNFGDGEFSNEFLGGVSIVRDNRQTPTDAPLILVRVGSVGATPTSPGTPSWLSAGGERFSQANILDQNIFQLQDNLTWSLGTHRLTGGTSNEFFGFRNTFLQAATGVWAFDCLDPTPTCTNALSTGNASAYQRRVGASGAQAPGTAKFSVNQLGFYVQDEWTAMSNLSITPGIRIDVPFLSSAPTNPALLSGNLPIDTSKVPTGNLLWSPRIGFNWDVAGNSNSILRGGVGIFSGRPPYVWVSNAYSINGLSQKQVTCAFGPNGTSGGTGVPAFTPDPNAQPTACPNTNPSSTNAGEIDYFDPNTKYPQNLRVAVGGDQRLPFGIIASADFLYTRDVNGWYTTDANLQQSDVDGDGRIRYGTGFTTVVRNGVSSISSTPNRIETQRLTNAVIVYNKDGGHVTSGTLQLQRPFGRRYLISVAYSYTRSLDRISFTSSQAFSNFQFAPLDGALDNRAVRPSAFDRPHKITVTGSAALPYGFGVGVSYVGQSGLPYTWTVNGDVNGDGVNGNDLVFVPKDQTQISLAPGSTFQQVNDFINGQSCLRDARGTFVSRGACRNQWQDYFDVRFSWTSPEFKWGQRIEVQWDIFNVLNLLNSNWGHIDQVAQFENAPSSFLRAAGYDAVNRRPIYAFTGPSTINNTVYNPTTSRWRMQLGARYVF